MTPESSKNSTWVQEGLNEFEILILVSVGCWRCVVDANWTLWGRFVHHGLIFSAGLGSQRLKNRVSSYGCGKMLFVGVDCAGVELFVWAWCGDLDLPTRTFWSNLTPGAPNQMLFDGILPIC